MMKQFMFLFAFFIICSISNAQILHIQTFGSNKNKALIFLHGGPGSNSLSFESTSAQKVADLGYYVITYDRRGEGRSEDKEAKYTFNQTFNDLNGIYKRFGLKKATLIGFSFGGIVATLYADKYTQNVQSVILVSSLISLQDTYTTILNSSEKIFQSRHNKLNLQHLAQAKELDRSSIAFRSKCFDFATLNGFFDTPHLSTLAKQLHKEIDEDPKQIKLRADTSSDASRGFWRNEKYTNIDIRPYLKNLINKYIKVYALYGKDDGLFSEAQIVDMQNLLGKEHIGIFDNCSHSLFVDQRTKFLTALHAWSK